MSADSENHSWFGPGIPDSLAEPLEDPGELMRLWRRFMTARMILGLVLLFLQGALYSLGQPLNALLLLICGAYFAATLIVRLLSRPRQLGRSFDPQWLSIIGVDVVAFTALQFVQGSQINYAPLFALPVLLSSSAITCRPRHCAGHQRHKPGWLFLACSKRGWPGLML